MSVDRLVQLAQRAPFAVVIVAPILASGFGLVAVGHGWLGLESWAGLLVPLTLDAAALSFAYLSWQATAEDEAAGLERLLVWVFAAASAGLNMWHADAVGGLHSAAFFGFASLTAALVWERMLHALQRRTLRKLGRVDKRAPRFRFLRWLLFPLETAGAFRLAVGEGISDPRAAIQMYRAVDVEDQAVPVPPLPQAPEQSTPKREHAKPPAPKPAPASKAAPPVPDAFDAIAAELAELSQPDALERAFAELGDDRFEDVPAARTWLADRGFQTDRSGAYKVAKRLRTENAPRLAVVGENA